MQNHLLGLIESHWGLGSDVSTDIFAADADVAMRAEFARYQRAASSAATGASAAGFELSARCSRPAGDGASTDVGGAPRPRPGGASGPGRGSRHGIAGSELVVLPGRSHLPYVGDREELVRVIRQFLGLRLHDAVPTC